MAEDKKYFVIFHYNVVNGGDKKGYPQGSTVIYRMGNKEIFDLANYIWEEKGDMSFILLTAERRRSGDWVEFTDLINLGNVTYIEWPYDPFKKGPFHEEE